MLSMLVTADVFQLPMGWLKAVADSNADVGPMYMRSSDIEWWW